MISHLDYDEFSSGFDVAEDISEVVERARKRGLIRGPEDGASVANWQPTDAAQELLEARKRRRQARMLPALDETGDQVAELLTVKSRWVDVTPAKAEEWLERNLNNRPVSNDVVQAYAREMLNGVWIPTHQGIAFNNKNELIDGQHRLLAIVLSGKTVRMMVTFGLPSTIKGKEMTAMDAVDRGRTRSVADQLKIQHQFKDGGLIAPIAASLGTLCHGERTRRMSVSQTLEIFRAYENEMLWVIASRARHPGLRVTGALAGFVFALATEPPFVFDPQRRVEHSSPIARMFTRLTTGEEMTARSPITLLREFLLSDSAKLLSRGTNRALAELVMQAIHLEIQGRAVDHLEMSLDGLNYFRARQAQRVERIGEIFRLPKVEKKKGKGKR